MRLNCSATHMTPQSRDCAWLYAFLLDSIVNRSSSVWQTEDAVSIVPGENERSDVASCIDKKYQVGDLSLGIFFWVVESVV